MVVQEAGRRTAQDETAQASGALPWVNMPLFLERAIELAAHDYEAADPEGSLVFFDRSLLDLILAYEHVTGTSKYQKLLVQMRYRSTVFFTPPWPEIYVRDAQRRHSFDEAVQEYDRLVRGYPKYGYDIHILSKTSVAARVKIIRDTLSFRG